PNPVTNVSQLNFLNLKNEPYYFSLTDITGRISEEKETTSSSIYIEKGNKPQGVYFYSLVNSITGEQVNGKFVID
ncbi:MAG: T9SS type A sorting domain-containing protein, partial [Bacteroidota bacterium]